MERAGGIDELVLKPRPWGALRLLLICSIFVAIGVWMAQEEGWIGYLCAGFFGLGIPIGLIELIPGSTQVRIHPGGVTYTQMFRSSTIPWGLVDQFFVVELRQGFWTAHRMVGFNMPAASQSVAAKVSQSLAKCHGALPNTYGKSAEELADLLNRCLAVYTQTSASASPTEPRST